MTSLWRRNLSQRSTLCFRDFFQPEIKRLIGTCSVLLSDEVRGKTVLLIWYFPMSHLIFWQQKDCQLFDLLTWTMSSGHETWQDIPKLSSTPQESKNIFLHVQAIFAQVSFQIPFLARDTKQMKGADKAQLETWERKNRLIKIGYVLELLSSLRLLYSPLSVFVFVFVKKDGSEYHACHSERSRQAPPCQGGGTASILLLPVSNSLQTLTRAPQCHCPCVF